MISRSCPKCSSVLRDYNRRGEMWLRCKECKLTLPAVALEVPDDGGLGDVKVLPVLPAAGLAGLKTPEKLFGDDFSSPTGSVT